MFHVVTLTMSEQFRVFLPSNASTGIYPQNNPADFQVQLNPPIQLEGDWQVGIENVCYDSAIENRDEPGRISIKAHTYNEVSANDTFDFPYVLTKDGKWNYEPIQLESSYYYGSDMPKVRDTLNSGNELIMKDKSKKVYEFSIKYWHQHLFYGFQSFSSGFSIRLNYNLMLHLGFGHASHLSYSCWANDKVIDKTGQLGKGNYKIRIFDSNVVECEERIILKKSGEKFLKIEELIERWNNTIGKKYGETAFTKKDKFNILKKNDKLTIKLSSALRYVVQRHTVLIGKGSFWGINVFYKPPHYNDIDEWAVEIYGDRIKKYRHYEQNYYASVSIPPRQFPTVDGFIQKINPHMEDILKRLLKSDYDGTRHHISLSIENQKTVLKLGKDISCYFTINLMKMFGFLQQDFTDARSVSVETPTTLDKRRQHLYIQTDLIPAVLYGDKKEYIMRDFIHNKDKTYGIIEKVFEPIIYHPVVKQLIPTISLKITNGLHECIHLKDTKTLITLIFRKAE